MNATKLLSIFLIFALLIPHASAKKIDADGFSLPLLSPKEFKSLSAEKQFEYIQLLRRIVSEVSPLENSQAKLKLNKSLFWLGVLEQEAQANSGLYPSWGGGVLLQSSFHKKPPTSTAALELTYYFAI